VFATVLACQLKIVLGGGGHSNLGSIWLDKNLWSAGWVIDYFWD